MSLELVRQRAPSQITNEELKFTQKRPLGSVQKVQRFSEKEIRDHFSSDPPTPL